ncbi:Xylosyltransferase oxt [Apiospora phragmitis]|uniref:Xylosyltransferase oxt n=1 Tax=Apiospora phragmitis TaxID=2905665 RepID=A0ABR1UR69_9PEZI
MAPSSPSQGILRLGVVVVAILVLFFYITSNISSRSAVELLRGQGLVPESSFPLGQNEAPNIRQSTKGRHVERDIGDLTNRNDVVPGIPSSLQHGFASAFPSVAPLSLLVPDVVDLSSVLTNFPALGPSTGALMVSEVTVESFEGSLQTAAGSALAGIAGVGSLPTAQLSASSPSTVASVGSPESAPAGGSLTPDRNSPTPRSPEGTVAGGSWTGGGNKPLSTGSPAVTANPGASVPTGTVSITATTGGQGSGTITITNTVYMAGVTSISATCGSQTTMTTPAVQGTGSGPCPESGYTCADCIGGWFCPPPQTPAQSGPNGCFGWACAHCSGGWFCVPKPTDKDSAASSTAVSSPAAAAPPLLRRPSTTATTQSAGAKPTIQNYASGWTYAGCWADQPHQPVLVGPSKANFGHPLTNEICVRHCLVTGYTLAATSFGDRCFCGQFLNGTQKLEAESQCSTPCAGDEAQVCGGSWALSCYSPDGQARGWAQFGEQPNPDVLDPPTVLSLAVGGVGVTVVTTPNNIFPTQGADLGQLQSQYGLSTQQSKAVLPSRVGIPGQDSPISSPGRSYSNPTIGNGAGTPSPKLGEQGGTPSSSSGGTGPCPTAPTTTMNTSPCASTGLNAPNADPLNNVTSSDGLTISGVESNPTLTLKPGGSSVGTLSTSVNGQSGTPSNGSTTEPDGGTTSSPGAGGGIAPRGGHSTTINQGQDKTPLGNGQAPLSDGYSWPSGMVP